MVLKFTSRFFLLALLASTIVRCQAQESPPIDVTAVVDVMPEIERGGSGYVSLTGGNGE